MLTAARTFEDTSRAQARESRLCTPADVGYDQARQAWNLALDQRPAAVARVRSVEDVIDVVAHARHNDLRIAAQGTGHNAAPLGSLHDTVLVRTDAMQSIVIDPHRRLARVAPGVLSQALTLDASHYALAPLVGSSPTAGVVGYTIGGGISFLSRRHGLAANRVRAIELVTADGRALRADPDHEPDLFWAVRGGGGSFGVVTALEIELLPVPKVYAGLLWFPIVRAAEVLHTWADLTRKGLPDELTTIGRLLRLPDSPDVETALRGKAFAVVEAIHVGEPRDADHLLSGLRALGPTCDTVRPISMPALGSLHMDPGLPIAAQSDGWMLRDLPAQALDVLLDLAGPGTECPLTNVELRHLDGAIARPDPGGGVVSSLNGRYLAIAAGPAPDPRSRRRAMETIESVKDVLSPWAAPRTYLNLAGSSQPGASLWDPPSLSRLLQIKDAVDPANIIRSNHPVRFEGKG